MSERSGKQQRAALWLAGIFLLPGIALRALPGVWFTADLCVCLAGLCILWAVLCRLEARRPLWGRVKRLLAAGLVCLVLLLAGLEIWVIRQGTSGGVTSEADAVLVLGAGVNGTTPSMALWTRIDKAAEYLRAHPGIPAVLSGGKGYGEEISEAQAMYDALLAMGISGERLILEERSANTSENFAFSRPLLEARGIEVRTATVAVVTNDFHMARVGIIGGRQGYGTLVRVGAELPWWWLSASSYLREAFAVVKTVLFDW